MIIFSFELVKKIIGLKLSNSKKKIKARYAMIFF